jgi:hypothetical protein
MQLVQHLPVTHAVKHQQALPQVEAETGAETQQQSF